jgi:hypothetical protein
MTTAAPSLVHIGALNLELLWCFELWIWDFTRFRGHAGLDGSSRNCLKTEKLPFAITRDT